MARVAQLKGTVVSRIELGSGVAFNLTTGDDAVSEDGAIRVTPEAFGKFLNSDSFVIPAVVVNAIRTDVEVTPKGKQ